MEDDLLDQKKEQEEKLLILAVSVSLSVLHINNSCIDNNNHITIMR